MNADSSWTVTAVIDAAKVHADSLGRDTPVPMAGWMDIGVEGWRTFGKDKELNDVPLVQQRVKLNTGERTFTFEVPGKPAAVTIDPDHLFFDSMPADNRKTVEVGE